MHIGYCTWTNPYDKKSSSGVHYFIMRVLEKYCDNIIPLGPLYNRSIIMEKLLIS